MAQVKITNTFTRTAKCPKAKRKEIYSDTVDVGLILEVRSTGTRTFYYRHSMDGKVTYTKLADASIITADKARTLVQKLKKNQELDRCITIRYCTFSYSCSTLNSP